MGNIKPDVIHKFLMFLRNHRGPYVAFDQIIEGFIQQFRVTEQELERLFEYFVHMKPLDEVAQLIDASLIRGERQSNTAKQGTATIVAFPKSKIKNKSKAKPKIKAVSNKASANTSVKTQAKNNSSKTEVDSPLKGVRGRAHSKLTEMGLTTVESYRNVTVEELVSQPGIAEGTIKCLRKNGVVFKGE